MIADELAAALRIEQRWAEKNKCPREPNFHELYQALGDHEAQMKIWENSDSRPCFILMRHARACEELPESFEPELAGKPCPNNPIVQHAELLDAFRIAAPLLEYARNIEDLCELTRMDPDTMCPYDWQIARIMRQGSRERQFNTLSSLFGIRYGRSKA